eukprot:4338168-Prymnesium_polylepis.1
MGAAAAFGGTETPAPAPRRCSGQARFMAKATVASPTCRFPMKPFRSIRFEGFQCDTYPHATGCNAPRLRTA